jgi:hypothetical protein
MTQTLYAHMNKKKNKKTKKKLKYSQTLVAYACTPSYSGGRNQEDYSLKPSSGK